ncbi:10709_t:CDS:2 [Acaulospora colombiana]|uniref:10709_t:CDS:1 n=1 Tax=Acaulospora colombiana TaxID=27376 RepID=A0ACA9MUF7_9GLOM|nr:10709_t:CDS:2 [Acaulospora colombiana]
MTREVFSSGELWEITLIWKEINKMKKCTGTSKANPEKLCDKKREEPSTRREYGREELASRQPYYGEEPSARYNIIAVKGNKWQDKPKSMVQTEDSSNNDGIKDDGSPPMSVMQNRESYMPRMRRKRKRLVILQYNVIAVKGNKWQDKPKSMVQTEDSSNDNSIKDNGSPPMSVMQDGKSYVSRMERKRKRLVILQYSVIAVKARQA